MDGTAVTEADTQWAAPSVGEEARLPVINIIAAAASVSSAPTSVQNEASEDGIG